MSEADLRQAIEELKRLAEQEPKDRRIDHGIRAVAFLLLSTLLGWGGVQIRELIQATKDNATAIRVKHEENKAAIQELDTSIRVMQKDAEAIGELKGRVGTLEAMVREHGRTHGHAVAQHRLDQLEQRLGRLEGK